MVNPPGAVHTNTIIPTRTAPNTPTCGPGSMGQPSSTSSSCGRSPPRAGVLQHRGPGAVPVADLVYGRRRRLAKFRVLELIARVPYQAWEQVAYVAITHTARPARASPGGSSTGCASAASQQDNEQWHLLILEELLLEDRRRATTDGCVSG